MKRVQSIVFLILVVTALAVICHHAGWGHMTDDRKTIEDCPLCSVLHSTGLAPRIVFLLLIAIITIIFAVRLTDELLPRFECRLSGNPFRAPPALALSL